VGRTGKGLQSMQPSRDEFVRLYRFLYITRRTEDTVNQLFQEGRSALWAIGPRDRRQPGWGLGQPCGPMTPLFPAHRAWPEYIGKGMSPASIVAEFIGEGTGCPPTGRRSTRSYEEAWPDHGPKLRRPLMIAGHGPRSRRASEFKDRLLKFLQASAAGSRP
jgi:TPP-dependent pyruvate/acetoin dehydrogenase alpha subunit